MRRRLYQHLLASDTALVLVVLVVIDRRDPMSFGDGRVIPDPARAGQVVTARRSVVWYRACEAEVSREVVGSDRIVRPYVKFTLRIPTRLGPQVVDSQPNIQLPIGLPAHAQNSYQAVLRFHRCGLTSRVWPLVVDAPPIFFDVVEP